VNLTRRSRRVSTGLRPRKGFTTSIYIPAEDYFMAIFGLGMEVLGFDVCNGRGEVFEHGEEGVEDFASSIDVSYWRRRWRSLKQSVLANVFSVILAPT
jgi:hypothetical protein